MITNYLLAYTLINGVVYQITVSLCPASLMGTALTITVRRTSVRPCVCRVHMDVNTVKSVFTTMSDLEKLLARQIGENAKKQKNAKRSTLYDTKFSRSFIRCCLKTGLAQIKSDQQCLNMALLGVPGLPDYAP